MNQLSLRTIPFKPFCLCDISFSAYLTSAERVYRQTDPLRTSRSKSWQTCSGRSHLGMAERKPETTRRNPRLIKSSGEDAVRAEEIPGPRKVWIAFDAFRLFGTTTLGTDRRHREEGPAPKTFKL